LSTTFDKESEYGELVRHGMYHAEFLYAERLLERIKLDNIPGAIVEFGVSSGEWLKHIDESMHRINLERPIYGFDSFEGLPDPISQYDVASFKKGMYAANIEDVKKYLKCDERPYIHLIKGWFADTLPMPEAQNIDQIAYARIDCDLYQPSVECLDYLKERLVDKAILIFDDWTHYINKGETKAFLDWAPNSGFEFDFLILNDWYHLYLQVHKKSI
jgi:hypothetical protein